MIEDNLISKREFLLDPLSDIANKIKSITNLLSRQQGTDDSENTQQIEDTVETPITSRSEPNPESSTNQKTISVENPQTAAPISSRADPDPDPTSTPDQKPDPQPDPQPDPNPDPNPDPKPEPNADPQPNPTPDPKPDPQPDPKSDPQIDPKPDPNPDPKSDPKPEPKPDPQPDPQSEEKTTPTPTPPPKQTETLQLPTLETPKIEDPTTTTKKKPKPTIIDNPFTAFETTLLPKSIKDQITQTTQQKPTTQTSSLKPTNSPEGSFEGPAPLVSSSFIVVISVLVAGAFVVFLIWVCAAWKKQKKNRDREVEEGVGFGGGAHSTMQFVRNDGGIVGFVDEGFNPQIVQGYRNGSVGNVYGNGRPGGDWYDMSLRNGGHEDNGMQLLQNGEAGIEQGYNNEMDGQGMDAQNVAYGYSGQYNSGII